MFISKHRRMASQVGCGVQYIPGHVEPFIDLVIKEYLPPTGHILDLGGGGLRFAVPVAKLGRRVIVVDLDKGGLDLHQVSERMSENDGQGIVVEELSLLIEIHISDMLEFLHNDHRKFSLVSAFRVAHFLSPSDLTMLFLLAAGVLETRGLFAVSAMTPYNFSVENDLNEVYRHSDPVSAENRLYRRFREGPEAAEIQRQQNLGGYVHLVDARLIGELARSAGFEVLVDGWQSTRIVAGYIMRRLNGVSE